LDTHAFLWVRTKDRRVAPIAHDILGADAVYVSIASGWEAAIKVGLGRLVLPEPFEDGVADAGFEPLPITFRHAREAGALPHHHRDPFDRMLIAQAIVEDLTIVTHDREFSSYDVRVHEL
jgi:PIN domain nuclease of toxin-antitoxin system